MSKLTDSSDIGRLSNMDEAKKVLIQYGLTENEATVYITCLQNERLTPFVIAKMTHIPRTTVYDALMNLSLKGLIRLDQGDVFSKRQTIVKANNPSVLRSILAQKREQLFNLEAKVSEVLPSLKGMFHKDDPNATIEFLPGADGVKKVHHDPEFESVNLPSYAWDKLMPLDLWGSEEMNRLVSESNQRRTQITYPDKELVPLNNWTKHVITYQFERDPTYLDQTEFRYIDNLVFDMYLRLCIKGEFVRISCYEEDEIWGLKINSKALAKSMLAIYQLTWQQAVPITKELITKWGKNEFLASQKKIK